MEFSFPFPKIGLEFSTWIPVPEIWEWNLPFPFPFPKSKSHSCSPLCHDGGTCGDGELGGKDGIGGPNQANLQELAFILWCLEFKFWVI